MHRRILIVTAVAAEADSVAGGLATPALPGGELPVPGGLALRRHHAPDRTVDVLVGGVGPAAAAAATGAVLTRGALAGEPYGLVVSAGIAGGFPGRAPLGSLVVADAIVAADLGADTPEGFLPVEELGFGRSLHRVPPALTGPAAAALAAAGLPHTTGVVLTVSTVTGGAARAGELAARHPGAAAEAMEGFGVAEAAAAHGVAVLELRAVSNAVGPRDRAAWRIGDALGALRRAVTALETTLSEVRPCS
ncbi:Futalosine hydrolase [Streptomyces omiyaensis]|uniref:futalosine hydrolase n=1 Tax=Streptomyces omiyaensis TaxID=68247 RepID=UPI0019B0F041|nr:futalosine hydrolase [Streptomyces omiyaensis]GGY24589.1 Futalosine hydrolase [Streptomyces omiyaensis]